MGRRNDAHIDLVRRTGAQRANFAVLQHPQQLDLQRQRQVADFVEQQRAAVGDVKQPRMVAISPGERAFAIAEQFAFQQTFGKGRTVLHHECVVTAWPDAMDGPRHQFFTGTGLTAQQHGAGAVSHLADQAAGFSHGRAVANQPEHPMTVRRAARRQGARGRRGVGHMLHLHPIHPYRALLATMTTPSAHSCPSQLVQPRRQTLCSPRCSGLISSLANTRRTSYSKGSRAVRRTREHNSG